MANDFHRNLVDADNHAVTAATYADIAARDADTAFHSDSANVSKAVRVDSPVSYYLLVSITPAWIELSSTELDTLAEVLANGNTTGGSDLIVSTGDDLLVTDHMSVGGVTAPTGDTSIDLKSATEALLMNRGTTAQKNAITPVFGMLYADTDLGSLQFYDSVSWESMLGSEVTGPVSSVVDSVPTFSNLTGDVLQDPNTLFVAGGKVGIGVAIPDTPLHIDVGTGTGAFHAEGSNTFGVHVNIESTDVGGGNWALISTGSGNPEGAGHFRLVNTATFEAFSFLDTGRLGINETSPQNLLHVTESDTGLTADSNSPLIIESNELNTFFTFLGPNTSNMGFLFGNATNNADGGIIYLNPTRELVFRTAGNVTRLTLGSTGVLTLTGQLDAGTNKLVNVVDPTAPQDAATKTYVDNIGAVFGPGSSSNNAVARWDGTTGELLKSSGANLSDLGVLSSLTGFGVGVAVPLEKAHVLVSGTSGYSTINRGMLLTHNDGVRLSFEDTGTNVGEFVAALRYESSRFTFFGLNDTGSLVTDDNLLTIDRVTGNVSIGAVAPSSARLDVASTTSGSHPVPRMTTVQKDAIAAPLTALQVFDNTLGRYEFFDGTKWKGLEEAALNTVYFTDESQLPAPITGQIPLAANTTYVMYNDDPSVSQKQVTIANEFLFPDAGGTRITSVGLATALLIYTGTGTFLNTTSNFTGFIHIDELFLACPSGTLFNIDGVLPVGSEYFPRLFMSNMGVFDTAALGTIKTISVNFNVGAFFDCGQGLTLDHTDEALIGDWRFANWKNEVGAIFLTARNLLRFPKVAACTLETGSNETAFNIKPSIGDETFIISTNTYRGDGADYATGSSGSYTGVINVDHGGNVLSVAGTPFGECIMTTDAAHGIIIGEVISLTTFADSNYNGTFEVLEVPATDTFRIHTLFTATGAGVWEGDRIQFAAVNTLSTGDGVQITDTSPAVAGYDGGYRVLGRSGTAFFVSGALTQGATGNFNTDSLDETDEPMLVVANAGLPSSAATFFGLLNGNAATTTILDGTYAAVNVTGLVAAVAQRFELTNISAGLWTYRGDTPAAGLFVANLSLIKTGSLAEYRFALSVNGATPVFASAFHYKAAVSPARSQITLGLPTGVLNNGDTVQIMVAGDGTTDVITISDGNEFLAITEN